MGVLASSLLPERFPVLQAVPPKMGKTLGLKSIVAWEGIGAVSEDKKYNFLHGAGRQKPLRGLEERSVAEGRGTERRNARGTQKQATVSWFQNYLGNNVEIIT